MTPRAERIVRALTILALGVFAGLVAYRSRNGGARSPCARCVVADECDLARPCPEVER